MDENPYKAPAESLDADRSGPTATILAIARWSLKTTCNLLALGLAIVGVFFLALTAAGLAVGAKIGISAIETLQYLAIGGGCNIACVVIAWGARKLLG